MSEQFPITGVVSMNSLEGWVWEEINAEGINLSYQGYQDYVIEMLGFSTYNELEEDEDSDNLVERYEEEMENYRSDEEEWLWGDWKLDENGKYVEDEDGGIGFSAYVSTLGGAHICHVTWSKTTGRFQSMCSPCCPGQADIDSGEYEFTRRFDFETGRSTVVVEPNGGILAYTLPAEYFYKEESA